MSTSADPHAPTARVLRFRSPWAHRDQTAYFGMGAFVWCWLLAVAFLVRSYLAADGAISLVPNSQLDVASTTATLLACSLGGLIAGSAVAFSRGRADFVAPILTAATLLAFVLFASLFAIGDTALREGLRPNLSPAVAVTWVLGALHTAAFVAGAVGLVWLTPRTYAGRYSPARHLPVRLWAAYWVTTSASWVVVQSIVF